MLGLHDLGWFVAAVFLLNITPGPDTAYIVARSVAQGRAAGVVSVLHAILRHVYPSRLLGRGMGINSFIVAVSSAAGPTIAGLFSSMRTAASAVRNACRRPARANAVNATGSSGSSSPAISLNSAWTSPCVRWRIGAITWLGRSPIACTTNSPRSVSTTSAPASSSAESTPGIAPGTEAPPPERFPALDLLRGFALCGILLMNVMTFAWPDAAYVSVALPYYAPDSIGPVADPK